MDANGSITVFVAVEYPLHRAERAGGTRKMVPIFVGILLSDTWCQRIQLNGFLTFSVFPSARTVAASSRKLSVPLLSMHAHSAKHAEVHKNLFIFGVGYAGLALAVAAHQRWGDEGYTISGTCRTSDKAEGLRCSACPLIHKKKYL